MQIARQRRRHARRHGADLPLRLKLGETVRGRPSRATVEATVVDVNRQTVSASASLMVHPADFYLGAKPEGESYFWLAGTPVRVGVVAVRPDGVRVQGVRVTGTIVRREWHSGAPGAGRLWRTGGRVGVGHRRALCPHDGSRAGVLRLHADRRVARSSSPSARPMPPGGGGRPASTAGPPARTGCRGTTRRSSRWTSIPDRTRYTVGDTATVLFASPFTNAEAWITVEREGLLQQRRLTHHDGTTTLKFPVTEALAPNAFVSIIVARGRSARPGPLDDPGRPTIRVGYAELRVTPERKRLTVTLKPLAAEYRPGDTARVALQVRRRRRAGRSGAR